jgi:hypothetical protein
VAVLRRSTTFSCLTVDRSCGFRLCQVKPLSLGDSWIGDFDIEIQVHFTRWCLRSFFLADGCGMCSFTMKLRDASQIFKDACGRWSLLPFLVFSRFMCVCILHAFSCCCKGQVCLFVSAWCFNEMPHLIWSMHLKLFEERKSFHFVNVMVLNYWMMETNIATSFAMRP